MKPSLPVIFVTTACLLLFQNCGNLRSLSYELAETPLGASSVEAKSWVETQSLGEGYDIIVVAGQSNAVGLGELRPVRTASDLTNDAKIFQVSRPDHAAGTRAPVVPVQIIPAGESLHFWGTGVDNDFNYGSNNTHYGFGMPFARLYAKNNLAAGRKILIVPAACGGSSISQWLTMTPSVDSHWDFAARNIYPDMLEKIAFAKAQPGQNRIVAFLWHQGETDIAFSTLNPPLEGMTGVAEYSARFSRLVERVRADLPGEEFPFIAGEWVQSYVPADPSGPTIVASRGRFRDMMVNLAANPPPSLGAFSFVRSNGLISNAEADSNSRDTIHFSTASLDILAGNYYATFLSLSTISSPVNDSYLQGLARLPSAQESTYWARQIRAGLTNTSGVRATLRLSLAGNAAARAQVIRAAYANEFGRDVQAGEMAAWDGILANGRSDYSTVETELRRASRTQAAQQNQVINNAYLNGFGWAPVASELEAWRVLIAQQGKVYGDIRLAIRPTFVNNPTVQRRAIQTAYLSAAGRAPTGSEVSAWSVRLNEGNADYETIVNALRGRPN